MTTQDEQDRQADRQVPQRTTSPPRNPWLTAMIAAAAILGVVGLVLRLGESEYREHGFFFINWGVVLFVAWLACEALLHKPRDDR